MEFPAGSLVTLIVLIIASVTVVTMNFITAMAMYLQCFDSHENYSYHFL